MSIDGHTAIQVRPGKASPTRHEPRRMRVHESCKQADDESLGYSAPSDKIVCPRCSELIVGTAAVVQRFPLRQPKVPKFGSVSSTAT